MKENIDIMAGIASMVGALLRGLKHRLSKRTTIINMVVAGFLSFGVIALLMIYLPQKVSDVRLVVFITFFIGWIANDFTDYAEKTVGDLYDILKTKFNSKTK